MHNWILIFACGGKARRLAVSTQTLESYGTDWKWLNAPRHNMRFVQIRALERRCLFPFPLRWTAFAAHRRTHHQWLNAATDSANVPLEERSLCKQRPLITLVFFFILAPSFPPFSSLTSSLRSLKDANETRLFSSPAAGSNVTLNFLLGFLRRRSVAD